MSHAFVLFLDFDGVLHPRTSGTCRHLGPLEAVLRRAPHVQVVVSSTWKHQNSLQDLRGWFSADIQERVIDVTPELAQGKGSRQQEIQAWLKRHPTSRWLALDDEPGLFEPNCPWLYLTQTATGLTASDLLALEALFQRASSLSYKKTSRWP